MKDVFNVIKNLGEYFRPGENLGSFIKLRRKYNIDPREVISDIEKRTRDRYVTNIYTKEELDSISGKVIKRLYFRVNYQDRQELIKKITDGMSALGSGELHGAALGEFIAFADVFGGVDKIGMASCDDSDLYLLAMAASDLVYAVGLLEGGLPLNELGYYADESLSLTRKDDLVVENSNRAFLILTDISERIGPKVRKDYNDIVGRLQSRRPEFLGRLISEESLKTFKEN